MIALYRNLQIYDLQMLIYRYSAKTFFIGFVMLLFVIKKLLVNCLQLTSLESTKRKTL